MFLNVAAFGAKHEACFAVNPFGLARIQAVSGKPQNLFGQNVSRLRSGARLTQEVLAERANISVRYLQFVEAGRYNPTVKVAALIRKALGCSWDDLCRGL